MTAAKDNASSGGTESTRPITAVVTVVLPNELFRLRLPDGSERVAHVAGDLRKAFTRLLPGDVVRIEISPLDPQKARILARLSPSGR